MQFFDVFSKYIQIIRINDLIDIVVVSLLIYYLINLIRETRAMQLFKGLLFIVAVFLISSILKLTALNYILASTIQIGLFALVVIFQPELRNMLERLGRFNVLSNIISSSDDEKIKQTETAINAVASAAGNMSRTKTGALMVLERETKLGEYLSTGTLLNADISDRLLINIFVHNTPLHDGAVIIRGDKIITAACVLPLSANTNISPDLGTRHRAALGLSETTDSVVVVVSEETGKISIAMNGTLTRNLTQEGLVRVLSRVMIKNSNSSDASLSKLKFWNSSNEEGKEKK